MSGYEIEIQSLIMAVMCSMERRVVVEEIEYQIIKYRQTEHTKKRQKTPSRIWFPNKTFFLFTVCPSAVLLVHSCFFLLFFERLTHKTVGKSSHFIGGLCRGQPASQPPATEPDPIFSLFDSHMMMIVCAFIVKDRHFT